MSVARPSISFFQRWLRYFLGRFGASGAAESKSVQMAELVADLAGKHIAIVGNSRALSEQCHGTKIDAADIVIRINRAPMPSVQSHGGRTDWLALATSIAPAEMARIKPNRILWMSHKRKRLRRWMTENDGFYLHPIDEFTRLASELNSPPTTGVMIIDLVARSGAAAINVYGFDFFASLSLTGSRTAAQVPHDFAAEKAWVDALHEHDARANVFR